MGCNIYSISYEYVSCISSELMDFLISYSRCIEDYGLLLSLNTDSIANIKEDIKSKPDLQDELNEWLNRIDKDIIKEGLDVMIF